MGRWPPNTKGRLAKAAQELYLERGYLQTTVAEIAARAGTTERTFFRHFADKSEVLFDGSGELRQLVTQTMQDAPADTSPLEIICLGIAALKVYFQGDTAPFRQRRELVARYPELNSRELLKMATLSRAMSQTLQARGVLQAASDMAAELGIVLFVQTYEQWLGGRAEEWQECLKQARATLQRLVSD